MNLKLHALLHLASATKVGKFGERDVECLLAAQPPGAVLLDFAPRNDTFQSFFRQ